ncbi:MAG TPA: nucleotidyltransferase [Thermoanaerobaculia bacterium]|jgi:predicted nucleotidyltransferase
MDFERILRILVEAGVEFVIVGGVAATVHGSARLTSDLDIAYGRTPENIKRLAGALAPLNPYLRGAPPNLPFQFDAATIRSGLNFTLTTDAGPLDCLGEVSGLGGYDDILMRSMAVTLYGITCRCLDLDALLDAKRAAGRAKDLEVIAELEAIREEM